MLFRSDILYDMVDPAYVILHRIGNTTYTPTNRHNGCGADRYYKVLLKRTEGARNAYNKARYVAKKEKQNVLSTTTPSDRTTDGRGTCPVSTSKR